VRCNCLQLLLPAHGAACTATHDELSDDAGAAAVVLLPVMQPATHHELCDVHLPCLLIIHELVCLVNDLSLTAAAAAVAAAAG
jgi:hypothetical protein